ncbi:MAG: Ig-like domain-containing protein, partial [Ginsengibacter sp.]
TDVSGATTSATVQVTVNAANIPPIANAGTNQTIKLPTNTAMLTGSGSDPDGVSVTYAWSKVGTTPTGGAITSPTAASTQITGLVQGTYQFKLNVTDVSGATTSATVQVTVNAANAPPKANAGIDQTISLLITNSATLNGTATDTDGNITGTIWTKISGPASGTITTANALITTVKPLLAGLYKFQLKVTDNKSATGLDTVQVTVVANIAPTANAGADQAIKLPTKTASLIGTGTDPDGTIATYQWAKISGTSSTITTPKAKNTTITSLQLGTYKFSLTVTDNKGATGKDTIQIVVAQSVAARTDGVALSGEAEVDNVNISWTAANETDVAAFEVEKSTANAWETIGSIRSIGGDVSGRHSFSDYQPADGLNYYRLRIVDSMGQFVYSNILNVEFKGRKNIMRQNVPNPFSATTIIPYEVSGKALVKIVVYNTEGYQVAVLVNEVKLPGSYQVQWNAANIPSGNYYYMLVVGNTVSTRKMLKLN